MKKIIKKQYYKIEFELASALSIGSGESNNTDKDIIIGSDKRPYIPASTIAGVCIDALDGNNKPENKKYKQTWGYIKKAEEKDKDKDATAVESSIIFYDALMLNECYYTSFRDSVALDEYKTAIQGQKFDMEVLEPEPGVKFVTYVEQSFYDNEEDIAKQVAAYFVNGDIYFGGKTSRGYGAIKNVKVYSYSINFSEAEADDIEKWARLQINDFGWVDTDLNVAFDPEVYKEKKITIKLRQVGGISIRKYTTETAESSNDTAPDFTQLTLSGDNKIPVIPGTSWAGAFEHQMKKYLGINIQDSEEWKEIFGFVNGKNKSKSKIRFSESVLENAISKLISRNAIDRFSGGTVHGALFTEITYYGGTTELIIGIDEKAQLSDRLTNALAASIVDLHYGILAVGGETSIGRGLFTIFSIEGIDTVPNRNEIEKANVLYSSIVSLINPKSKEDDNLE